MNKRVMKLASRGKRLGAYCLDEIIPAILRIVVFTSICFMITRSNVMMYGNGYGYSFGTGNIGSSLISLTVANFIYLIYLIIQVVFYTKSKTIGKALLGMQVVSSKNGEPVSVWYMILREWFAKKASAAVFFLGYIWVLVDDKNRAWHDKIMDTYVIDTVETDAMNKAVIDKVEIASQDIDDLQSSEDVSADKEEEIELDIEASENNIQ